MSKLNVLHVLEITVVVLVLCVILVLFIVTHLPIGYRNKTEIGKPYIETNDDEYAGEITSIASDGSYLYICYGKRHVVKVFDFEAHYVCTIAISDKHNEGGTLGMCEKSNQVVLYSERHSYVFDQAHMVSFDPQGGLSESLHSSRRTTDKLGNTYYMQKGNVVKDAAEGAVSTFYKPHVVLRHLNPHIIFCLVIVLFIVWIVLHSLYMNT